MGEHVKLRASDGHELDAYVAVPPTTPIAGLIVVQEAFGVNRHIRSVADAYAQDGFLAIAPALYDRQARGVEFGYTGEEAQKGLALARSGSPENWVKDVAAAIEYARRQTEKRVGVIGYCLGGSVAWLAATRLQPDAGVGYYGGRILNFAGENPHSPVMLHFGLQDQHIPKHEIDSKVAAVHPEVQIYWYEAGHGFNTSDRGSYNAEAARLARERSLKFLRQHLAA
jgi:carboxymethylenebutenolidase